MQRVFCGGLEMKAKKKKGTLLIMRVQVSYTEKYSSHSCRGLWEITPRSANGQSQRLTKFMTDGEEV